MTDMNDINIKHIGGSRARVRINMRASDACVVLVTAHAEYVKWRHEAAKRGDARNAGYYSARAAELWDAYQIACEIDDNDKRERGLTL